MMIVLAITIMQLVIRFMRVATSRTSGRCQPALQECSCRHLRRQRPRAVLVLTGWWQYLWVLFGGANQLMASLALMLVTAWLMSEGKVCAWTFYPMIFMFITTVAALLYTSYTLLGKVLSGAVQGRGLIGNTLMGVVGFFLVIAAIILGMEGFKAFGRYRTLRAQAAPAAEAVLRLGAEC